MKFTIRKRYKIMGKTIKVKIVDTPEYAGLWDASSNTIYLSSQQTQEQLLESFWHECNHMMQWFSGTNQAVSRELLEIMAEMNSRIISQIILES